MSFEKLISFTKKVADLADKPTLNPSELKARFDAAPDEVRQYLNKLIDALIKTTAGDSGAKNIGVTSISGITGNDVQSILENIVQRPFIRLSGGSSTPQNLLSHTDTVLTYATLHRDSGNMLNLTNGYMTGFKAPFSGRYLVSGQVDIPGLEVDSNPVQLRVNINNVIYKRLAMGAYHRAMSGSTILELNQNDTVNLSVYQSSPVTRVTEFAGFEAHYIGG
jgi:hypothetical protein